MTSTLPARTGLGVPAWVLAPARPAGGAAPSRPAPPPAAAPEAGDGAGAVPSPEDGPAPLTRARRAAGLTVTGLARALHVSRPTVSMWESGARAAARGYWPALGRALGLAPDEVAALFAGCPPARHDGQRLPSLAVARRRAGLTQRELAGRVGVASTTLSMWETGGVPVPAALLAPLEQLLATDLCHLMSVPPPETGPDPRPLRHFRQVAGMSQREAAAHLRIAVGTLARYEAGERATPIAVVRRMAAAYHRSVSEVLRHSGTQVPPLPPGPWTAGDVPAALSALRCGSGLTKAELGRAVGRSGQAVRAWETGRARPAPATCRRLEAVFGLPAGRFRC